MEAYLAEAAPYSDDCKALQSRLVGSWAGWPKAGDETLVDWRRFLERLKVKDGLQPVAADMPASGTWSDRWHAFLHVGLPKEGFGEAWTDEAKRLWLQYPHTNYTRDGEGWRLPGQLEHDELPDGAKAKFSDLIVAYLRQQGDRHFRFRLGAYHRPASQQDVTSFPTPLQVFLRAMPWLAIYPKMNRCSEGPRNAGAPGLVGRHRGWLIATSLTPPLGIPAILFDEKIGLQDWSASETAAARLSSLSAAAEGLASTDRRDFRELLRRAGAT